MPMHEDQLVRYARNISLQGIGREGQERLLGSKVLVVGAGGLGSPLLLYLAAAGVGTIGVVDNDRVELSNLQRQIIHEAADVGVNKALSAKDALYDLNPDISVIAHDVRLSADNAEEIIGAYDIVADGSDNFETRFLVHDTCFVLNKTLVSAAIQGFLGQISTFKAYQGGQHPCYRCLYPEIPPAGTLPNCSQSGVLGATGGVMGSWQAAEVVKELTGAGKSLSGFLLIVDMLDNTIRKVKIHPDKACMLCHDPLKDETSMMLAEKA